MGKEKSFHSFKEFAQNYYKEHPEFEKQKLLQNYGLDISIDDIDDIDILEQKKESIKLLNKKTNEIIESNLFGRIHDKYSEKYSVSLSIHNQDKDYFIDNFNSIKPARTYEEAGKNAVESRKDSNTLLLSRVYKDISTKYGNFCLVAEENYSNYKFGPHKIVSLYHGSHDRVIDEVYNDFEISYCIFRWKYYYDLDFNQWMLGYNEYLGGPFGNRWSYGKSNYNNEKIKEPFYGSHIEKRYSIYSQFILNNKVKIKDNSGYLSDYFNDNVHNRNILNVDEEKNVPRIYFGDYNEFISIIKEKYKIIIKYYNKKDSWFLDDNIDECKSMIIESKTKESFTLDDFINIINKIRDSYLDEEFKNNVICELKTYINLHDSNDLKNVNNLSLKEFTFENMVENIKQDDLPQIIENMLEDLSQIFNIDINELIGVSPISNENLQKVYD